MKHLLKFAVAAALAGGFLTVRAADAKDVTVTGTGACAKCELKKADSCQNVVQVKDGDKTTTYFLTGDVSKAFHKNLCSSTMKVTVSGNATHAGDKTLIAVTKIEPAKYATRPISQTRRRHPPRRFFLWSAVALLPLSHFPTTCVEW